MRRMLPSFAAVMLTAASLSLAEPLVLEQAGNVLAPRTLEAGLSDITFQSDETKITDNAGNVARKLTTTSFDVPVFGRYAFDKRTEAFASIPFRSASTKTEVTGSGSATADASGIVNPLIGGKYMLSDNFYGWKIGAAASVALPFGDKKLATGLDLKPLVAARRNYSKFAVNANLSYDITGEYEDDADIKRDPGDILTLGVGAEYPVTVKKLPLDLIGEFLYQSLSDSKTAGATVSDSSGSRMDLVLGARYNRGSLKTKLGFDLSLGDEKTRAYDYRVIAGVTYLLNI